MAYRPAQLSLTDVHNKSFQLQVGITEFNILLSFHFSMAVLQLSVKPTSLCRSEILFVLDLLNINPESELQLHF